MTSSGKIIATTGTVRNITIGSNSSERTVVNAFSGINGSAIGLGYLTQGSTVTGIKNITLGNIVIENASVNAWATNNYGSAIGGGYIMYPNSDKSCTIGDLDINNSIVLGEGMGAYAFGVGRTYAMGGNDNITIGTLTIDGNSVVSALNNGTGYTNYSKSYTIDIANGTYVVDKAVQTQSSANAVPTSNSSSPKMFAKPINPINDDIPEPEDGNEYI